MKLDKTIFFSLMLSLPSHHLLTFRILHMLIMGGGGMDLCLVSRQCLKANGHTFNTSRGRESENPVGIC